MKKLFGLFVCLCGFLVEASASNAFVAAQTLGKIKLVVNVIEDENSFNFNFFPLSELDGCCPVSPVKKNRGACPVSPVSPVRKMIDFDFNIDRACPASPVTPPVRTKKMRYLTPDLDCHLTPDLGAATPTK